MLNQVMGTGTSPPRLLATGWLNLDEAEYGLHRSIYQSLRPPLSCASGVKKLNQHKPTFASATKVSKLQPKALWLCSEIQFT